jgi:putative FmdB family regulatory protein
MPIFDYECPQCDLISDVWAKMNEAVKECPRCGRDMKRLMSASNVICDIEPYLDGHMAQNPVPVFSRQHKKEELKKRGLVIK